MEEEGIVLLESPIGSLDFERRVIGERIEKVREIYQRLPLIQDPQTESAQVLPVPPQVDVYIENH